MYNMFSSGTAFASSCELCLPLLPEANGEGEGVDVVLASLEEEFFEFLLLGGLSIALKKPITIDSASNPKHPIPTFLKQPPPLAGACWKDGNDGCL